MGGHSPHLSHITCIQIFTCIQIKPSYCLGTCSVFMVHDWVQHIMFSSWPSMFLRTTSLYIYLIIHTVHMCVWLRVRAPKPFSLNNNYWCDCPYDLPAIFSLPSSPPPISALIVGDFASALDPKCESAMDGGWPLYHSNKNKLNRYLGVQRLLFWLLNKKHHDCHYSGMLLVE